MTKKPSKPAKKSPFPSREEILQYIRSNPKRVGKRDIARAFKLDSRQKMALKKALREMELDGTLERGRGRRVRAPEALPPVAVVEITGTDRDGELLARPVTWDGDGEAPRIYMVPGRRGRPAPGPGDRVLARLTPTGDGEFEGRTIRAIAAAPRQILGIFEKVGGESRLRPTDKRSRGEFAVDPRDTLDAGPGDLVRAEPLAGRKLGLRQARIVEVVHGGEGPASPSMIAVADYDLPTRFSAAAEKQAVQAGPAPEKDRDDFRSLPLVTIDGADARDFDDAVWAEPDPDKKNPGGWHLLVAIADVAWYVRPGDALDRDAYERGNSVYFPDRVVPMLPEALSNGWCSLVPGEDRPCVAVDFWIDASGKLLRHQFRRGVMRSAARLTYEQVQAARDGNPDKTTGPLLDTVITPLFGAYQSLLKGRAARQALELEMPERRIELAPEGTVTGIGVRRRLDSHKLIEEFMITANVAAAETLEKAGRPCMYRVHDQPSKEKLEALRNVLDSVGIRFARGGMPTPKRFNQILKKAAATRNAPMVNEMVLRSQAQAEYAPDNIGHFGLALVRYCHFTSPIRRYADLLVHRALIAGGRLGLGNLSAGLEKNPRDFADIGEHLSMTERRAAGAERDAIDRFIAAFLADRIGAVFQGRINGVTRFGLFVTLTETGADGLVPMRTLADDYYVHDETRHSLRGRNSGIEYRLGDEVEVRLTEANPVTGGMVLALMDSGALPSVKKGAKARGGRLPRRAKGHAKGGAKTRAAGRGKSTGGRRRR
ncbi:MAG: ribonuclease R [Proteobacteria bacterium]|nr:ribonuclease R [Pseudomonadota bacterium]